MLMTPRLGGSSENRIWQERVKVVFAYPLLRLLSLSSMDAVAAEIDEAFVV